MDSDSHQPDDPDEGASMPRRAIAAGARSLRSALALPLKATAAARIVVIPVRLVPRVDRALGNLDDIARGVDAMHGEFVGMRGDILALDERVEGLRQEIGGLRGEIVDPVADVTPMLAAVRALDARIEALGQQLESVDALALRLGRWGRARARPRPDANGEATEVAESGQAREAEAR